MQKIFVNNLHRYLQRLPKIEVGFSVLEWHYVLDYPTGARLDEIIDNVNFHLQRLGSH